MVYIVGMGYNIAKKSYHTTASTIIGAGLAFGLHFLLIPRWGILGAAMATMFGNMATLVYCFFWGQLYFTVPYEYRRVGGIVVLSTAVVLASMMIDQIYPHWQPTVMTYKSLIYLGFLASLFFFNIIRRQEVDFISHFFKLQEKEVL